MNKVFTSVFAAVFAFCSTAAFASNNNVAIENHSNAIEMTDAFSVENSVIMRIAISLPDGSTARKKAAYSSMVQALVAYHQFAATLPYGSKVTYVEFTDNAGNTIFSYQG